MKPGIRNTRLAALLLGAAMLPAYAAGDRSMPGMSEAGMSFKGFDANKDGYLSLEEFQAKGLDDLAFKAADLDSDNRVDPSEFDKYVVKKATDQAKPEPGAEKPKPAQPPAGY